MHSIVDYMAPPREQCYSCFSHAYLPMWNVLMLHYFPPRTTSLTDAGSLMRKLVPSSAIPPASRLSSEWRAGQMTDKVLLATAVAQVGMSWGSACRVAQEGSNEVAFITSSSPVETDQPHKSTRKPAESPASDPNPGPHDTLYTDDKQAVMRGCVDRFLLFGLDDDVKTGLMSVDRRHSNICRKSNRKILKMYPLSSENDPVYLCTCIGPRCNEEDMMDRLNGSPFVPPTIPTLLLIAAYRLFNA
ncbi:unnamed protein product, partial [Mesorhabditis spiculigera]